MNKQIFFLLSNVFIINLFCMEKQILIKPRKEKNYREHSSNLSNINSYETTSKKKHFSHTMNNIYKVIERINTLGENINKQNNKSETILHCICLLENPQPKIVEALLRNNADITLKNIFGDTALDYAIENYWSIKFKFLNDNTKIKNAEEIITLIKNRENQLNNNKKIRKLDAQKVTNLIEYNPEEEEELYRFGGADSISEEDEFFVPRKSESQTTTPIKSQIFHIVEPNTNNYVSRITYLLEYQAVNPTENTINNDLSKVESSFDKLSSDDLSKDDSSEDDSTLYSVMATIASLFDVIM